MPYVITDRCLDVKDRSCVQQCPVDCIYEGERMLYIHPDECIDCGACEPVCPQEAIYLAAELPEDKAAFAAINVEFFALEGRPTVPAGEGETGPDHPAVVTMPGAVTE